MRVRLEQIEQLNYNVFSFNFSSKKSLNYTAGQYIEMHLPGKTPDSRGPKRWFTLSSSPSEKMLTITTKFAGDQSSEFKHHLQSLKVGNEVEISEAMGDFVLPIDKTIPLIFVAGGIGATPYRSMIKWLIDRSENRQIKIILAANSQADIVFADLFKSYGLEPIVVINSPSPTWRGESGRLTGKRIIDLVGPIKHQLVYLSGPEAMVENLETDLKLTGISQTQIVGDFFPGYPADLA